MVDKYVKYGKDLGVIKSIEEKYSIDFIRSKIEVAKSELAKWSKLEEEFNKLSL